MELVRAWTQVRNSSTLRVLKIVHGYGSSGKGGSTKEVVRNWVFRKRAKFGNIIDGENYSLFDPGTQRMRTEIGEYADVDLGSGNSGITIVWVK